MRLHLPDLYYIINKNYLHGKRMLTEKQNLLLFSLQLGDWPYKYKLYFAEAETVADEDPVIHCFCVCSRKKFFSLEDVKYVGIVKVIKLFNFSRHFCGIILIDVGIRRC